MADSRGNDSINVPFWNTNLPPELHTKDCPSYLEYAFTNEKDRQMLSTPDSEYRRQTWPEVQQIINDNRLDLFLRVPSDLRRYREYCARLTEEYGTVMAFVMRERLRWKNVQPTAEPFQNPVLIPTQDDYTILHNDWPYGIDTRIVHLVIWTKFELPAEPITAANPIGDLRPEARRQINDFVDKTFVSVCGRENVIWFKNWSSLKSIHAIEHFHVMLFDPDREFVRRITNGDMPLAEKVGKVGEII
ncbi:hypothetical protein LTR09_003522 [Extremus antarcticus]|uniref:N-acetylglucosamine-induced protein 1 n=1 Tax=Extremus antarcticus TaxID=702011 RepID=A0AAJ0DRL4_9PEZI|nr:hypothetical protein LTR09_003522 [Extremus antarcticus]